MTLRKSNWIAAACVAALYAASGYAQDNGQAGIVRISDSRMNVQPASFHGHSGGYGYGSDCPNCDCYGAGPNCFHGFFKERYCKNSPDHGYSPPAKYPLLRRGVEYNQYFPNQWYGTPGATYQAAPMVYQPTDTTQLGYHYQHVPFWQPNPAMMPQRPVPAQWHIVAPPVYASSFHNMGGYGYGAGAGYNCPTPGAATVPSTNGQPTPLPATTPADGTPLPEASIPQSPRQFEDSAASGHIRRAGY